MNAVLLKQDHPRSRGENPPSAKNPPARLGSPPLTRGKHSKMQDFMYPGGITPAHAGKTPLKKAFLRNQKLKFHLVLNTPDIEFCSPPLHDVVYYTLIQNTAQVFLI